MDATIVCEMRRRVCFGLLMAMAACLPLASCSMQVKARKPVSYRFEPGRTALLKDGVAYAPRNAPRAVKKPSPPATGCRKTIQVGWRPPSSSRRRLRLLGRGLLRPARGRTAARQPAFEGVLQIRQTRRGPLDHPVSPRRPCLHDRGRPATRHRRRRPAHRSALETGNASNARPLHAPPARLVTNRGAHEPCRSSSRRSRYRP